MTPDRSPNINRLNGPKQLAQELAVEIGTLLTTAINEKGSAILAVSGGSTPKKLFKELSRQSIDWAKVTVTLVDERRVPPDSPRSNQKLVAENLLVDAAADATFQPLYLIGNDQENAEKTNLWFASAGPIDVVILGMGSDGHTASFFPDATGLQEVVDPATSARIGLTKSEASLETRLTITLPVILEASHVFLHIEGEEKDRVLGEALQGGEPGELPIRYVLNHRPQLDVYWAP